MKSLKHNLRICLTSVSFYLKNNMKSQNQTKQVVEEDIRIEKNEQGIETYLFDPYNPLNNPISQNDVKNILSKYGIQS